MALLLWLLASMGGKRSQRPGSSPTLESLGPFHLWHHISRVSPHGAPCIHDVVGTPYGEVHDKSHLKMLQNKIIRMKVCWNFTRHLGTSSFKHIWSKWDRHHTTNWASFFKLIKGRLCWNFTRHLGTSSFKHIWSKWDRHHTTNWASFFKLIKGRLCWNFTRHLGTSSFKHIWSKWDWYHTTNWASFFKLIKGRLWGHKDFWRSFEYETGNKNGTSVTQGHNTKRRSKHTSF
jgi:hypothetical protein